MARALQRGCCIGNPSGNRASLCLHIRKITDARRPASRYAAWNAVNLNPQSGYSDASSKWWLGGPGCIRPLSNYPRYLFSSYINLTVATAVLGCTIFDYAAIVRLH